MSRYRIEDRSLCRLLVDQASAFPDRTWVVFDSTKVLTYGEALHTSLCFASRLVEEVPHDGKSVRVGVLLRNCPEFLVAVHGTLLAGGVAFLLNPDLPALALQVLLEKARLDWLLVDADTAAAARGALAGLTALPPRVLAIDDEWAGWLQRSEPAAPRLPRHDSDALVLYTSGTTGSPKGVVASHHYAFMYSAMLTDTLRRNASDVISGALPLFHASGLHTVAHSALQAGATAHIKRHFSASRYWEEIAADGATTGGLVPEMARMILRRAERVPPHRMRTVLIGGLLDRDAFERRFKVKVLWHAYGMTEAYPCPMNLDAPGGPEVTIGMPMDYIEYGVVDEQDRFLAPGESGELVLRTPPHFMFERYLDDEAATQKAMRGGFLHTGDRMSISPEGLLSFRGRAAQRIRHHGENVDPLAIEQASLAFHGVLEAAAYAVPGELGDDDVKLDVVAQDHLDLVALRDFLAQRLPRKAVPRYLEQRAELPRTASFKVQLHRLREDGVDRPAVMDAGADMARRR